MRIEAECQRQQPDMLADRIVARQIQKIAHDRVEISELGEDIRDTVPIAGAPPGRLLDLEHVPDQQADVVIRMLRLEHITERLKHIHQHAAHAIDLSI